MIKKFILFVLLLCLPVVAHADILATWTVDDPAGAMTRQSIYYRQDPGATGDRALLDGTGFTAIILALTDRERMFTGLVENSGYCFYWEAESAGDTGTVIFRTDVVCRVNAPARTVKRVEFFRLILDEDAVPVR